MAYDNSGNSSVTPFGFTTAGTNRILVVGVYLQGTNPLCTGVTYNGVAMSKVNGNFNSTQDLSIWQLLAPASGAHNVAWTTSGTIGDQKAAALSLSGMNQVGSEAGASSYGANVTTISAGITTIHKNAEVISFLGAEGVVASITANNGATVKTSSLTGAAVAMSYKEEVTPGATTAGWDRNDSNQNEMSTAVATLVPLQIVADSGSFSFSFQSTSLLASRLFSAAAGSFSITSYPALFRLITALTNTTRHTGSLVNQVKNRRLGSYLFDEIGATTLATVGPLTFDTPYTPATNQAKHTASLTNQPL